MPNQNSNCNILAMLAIDEKDIDIQHVANRIVVQGKHSGFKYFVIQDWGTAHSQAIGYQKALLEIAPETVKLKKLADAAEVIVNELEDF